MCGIFRFHVCEQVRHSGGRSVHRYLVVGDVWGCDVMVGEVSVDVVAVSEGSIVLS